MNQPLSQPFIDTIEGYIQRNMPVEAATECLRMVQAHEPTAEMLIDCGNLVMRGSVELHRQLLAVIDSYLVGHADDSLIKKERVCANAIIKLHALQEALAVHCKSLQTESDHDLNDLQAKHFAFSQALAAIQAELFKIKEELLKIKIADEPPLVAE